MNIAGKTNATVGNSILIGAFIAFSSAAAWRLSRLSVAWTRRILPSEMPSWSAWMIARTNDETSGVSTRPANFFSASERDSPTRISPRARDSSSTSDPSMCSVSFAIAPSKPRPASTLTASRSSASGSSRPICSRRRVARLPTIQPGAIHPPATNASVSRRPVCAPATAVSRSPSTSPPPARIAFAARKPLGDTSCIPAASSFCCTESRLSRGLRRSIRRAIRPEIGTSIRSCRFARSRSVGAARTAP